LNAGREWAKHSDQAVTIDFGTSERVTRFGIRTNFGGGFFGDNWEVDAVQLERIDGTGGATSVAILQGSPFVRLTGDHREFMFDI
jgi:hypothetical protein